MNRSAHNYNVSQARSTSRNAFPPGTDPLSITVGIVTITGAIRTTGKGVASLRNIHDGPKEQTYLLSEIDELHDFFLQIHLAIDGLNLQPANQEKINQGWTIEWIKEEAEKADETIKSSKNLVRCARKHRT